MAPKKQPKRETAGKRNSAKKGLADRHSAFVREYACRDPGWILTEDGRIAGS